MNTVLVTGANRGIGLEFCRQFKQRGDDVIATCRNTSVELDEIGVRIESGVEVTNEKSLVKLVKSLGDLKLDIVINNAGIMSNESLNNLDFNNIRRQFEINSLGPLFVSNALLPLFSNPAKLVLITSRMGSITDNTSGSYYGYRMSKAALNIAGVSLSHDLKDRNIAVGILHPGFVKTDLTGQAGDVTPDQSVKNMLKRIDELTIENSGTFWHANGEILNW